MPEYKQKYSNKDYLEAFLENNQNKITVFYEEQEKIFKNGILNWANNKSKMVYSFVRHNIDDIFQDTFIRLHTNIIQGKITNEALNVPLGGYMFYIGKNITYEYLHDAHLDIKIENDENDTHEPTFVDTSNPNIPEISQAEKMLIREYVEKLSEKCYKILNLFYYGKISMKGIANMLGYANEDVAKSKKHTCLSQLKKLIKKHLYGTK